MSAVALALILALTAALIGASSAVAQASQGPQSLQVFPTQQLERPEGGFRGGSLEIDGDTAVIGTTVYTFDGSEWQPSEQLELPSVPEGIAEEGFRLGSFGRSAAISGDTIVVSGAFVAEAPVANANGTRQFFATYERRGGSWELQGITEVDISVLTAGVRPNGIDDVDISGDTVVVGDSESDGTALRSGIALIFTRQDGDFVQTSFLAPDDVDRFDDFGSEVAVDGTTVVVGNEEDSSVTSSGGAAYVFENGVQVEKLTAPQPAFLGEFGKSLAVEEDTVAVSSGGGDGEVFLFGRDTGGANQWGLERQFAAPDKPDSLGATGFDVALSGPRVILGTTGLDSDGQLAPGTVYQFDRSEAGQDGPVAQLVLERDNGTPRFGVPVALSGDQALAVAPNLDGRGNASVFAYTLEQTE